MEDSEAEIVSQIVSYAQEITIENGNPLYEGETQEGVNPLYGD